MCVFVCVGPFWICVTLVFSVAISGNLSTFLTKMGTSTYHYRPQFHRGQSCSGSLINHSEFVSELTESCFVSSFQ